MTRFRWSAGWLCFLPVAALAQIDPVKRDLVQLGYDAALQGHAPLAGYAFYYRNDPGFLRTNLTLRLAVAPVYLDSELGVSRVLGERTDIGIGLAGGGFADSYSEVREGKYLRKESFLGHSSEGSLSLYHLFNPERQIPLNFVLRGSMHHAFYERDNDTADDFVVPEDRTSFCVRTGLRWGGREPTLAPSLAMELSAWYEGEFTTQHEAYGFDGDRRVEPHSHRFWTQALLAYTLPELQHNFYVSLTAGTSIHADRFSAYRLGALLPLASEFPLSLPGYYHQELSARQFVLLGGNYLLPLDAKQRWSLSVGAATALVDYLPGTAQAGHSHSGVGAGLLYRSPADTLKVMVMYGYGVDAIRDGHRGAHSIGMLLQVDLNQARGALLNPENPDRWRGWQRLLGI
ncbi:MAG: hypothetical protein KIS67_12830 [Verrucomicrobiae bacterium]|nr:hypothetical protein [Verrucomicrobiae bacterium]